jgi:hypothetical protein
VRVRHQIDRQPGIVGRLFGTVFFSVFMAFGVGMFSIMFGDSVLPEIRARSWVETPCTITKSDDDGFEYRYRVDGRYRTSSVYKPSAKALPSGSEGSVFRAERPVGSDHTCRVNPDNPNEAALELGSLWICFVLIFPLVFAGIGIGGIYSMWRGKKSRHRKGGTRASASISEKDKKNQGRLFCFIFGFAFFAAGAGAGWGLFIWPLIQSHQAKSWDRVPAKVISSRVESHSSDDGSTYSVDIYYSYEVNGAQHHGSRYDFVPGSSSGYKSKKRIVDQYPPGQIFECYVNPENPRESVIKLGLGKAWWFVLLPLIFVGIGGVFMAASFMKESESEEKAISSKAKHRRSKPDKKAARYVRQARNGQIVLKPVYSRWGKVCGAIFVAAFWNGIVSVFVFEIIDSFARGRPEWFGVIFLTPFVLIGIGLICHVVYQVLALLNPVPMLAIKRTVIRVGDSAECSWAMKGRLKKLTKLVIVLEGVESASYQRGTTQITDKSTFYSVVLLDSADPREMAQGLLTISIPPDSVPSHDGPNNKIIWQIVLKGEIPLWPDLDLTFPVTVHPMDIKKVAR